jgi:hypothetical protein
MVKAMAYRNKEDYSAYQKWYRETHKAKCNKLVNEWRKRNPDYHKAYYVKNRDSIILKQKEWNDCHKDERKEDMKNFKAKHPGYWVKWRKANAKKNREDSKGNRQ